jgi:putative membrane protein
VIGFLFRAAIVALGLWLATRWVSGITINTPTTLLLAALLLGIVNAIVRPIAVLLTLPVTLFTLGLFLLVVNAAMLALVALFLPGFGISGFWAAFFAAVIVSITGWIGSWLIGSRAKVEFYSPKG